VKLYSLQNEATPGDARPLSPGSEKRAHLRGCGWRRYV
jgi:hypothetical protein